jgi:hypothetical protein
MYLIFPINIISGLFTFFPISGDVDDFSVDNPTPLTFGQKLLGPDKVSRAQVSGNIGMMKSDLRVNKYSKIRLLFS